MLVALIHGDIHLCSWCLNLLFLTADELFSRECWSDPTISWGYLLFISLTTTSMSLLPQWCSLGLIELQTRIYSFSKLLLDLGNRFLYRFTINGFNLCCSLWTIRSLFCLTPGFDCFVIFLQIALDAYAWQQ